MKSIQLILGGCRSGKSRYALNHANKQWKGKKYFIATCEALDHEMQQRIDCHKKERGPDWQTIECPIDIDQAIAQCAHQQSGILLDCITLWISNMMCKELTETQIKNQIISLTKTLSLIECSINIVSNEVGLGIVPENLMARQYRDIVGFANQQIAAVANQVILMVAGIPLSIKECSENNFPIIDIGRFEVNAL